jgi:hypothetical protein
VNDIVFADPEGGVMVISSGAGAFIFDLGDYTSDDIYTTEFS